MRIRAYFLALLLAGHAAAQNEEHGYTPAQVERGEQAFLSGCASCHGINGDGIAGTNLASGRFRRAASDRELIGIIQRGIPGTPMPPSSYTEQQAETIVAYMRSLAKAGPPTRASSLAGDATRGKALFEGKGQCLGCHQANGKGAFLAPDLSGVGAFRRQAALERSLLEPGAEIRNDNQVVQVVTRQGASIKGRLLNYDTYSVQLLDASGKLFSLNKADLRQFDILKTSAMPSYAGKFTDQEMADLLTYLGTLKGGAQ